jgi:hypothetical protein
MRHAMHAITKMRILLMAAKQGLNLLICMPNGRFGMLRINHAPEVRILAKG